MSDWKPRRFRQAASVEPVAAGFAIRLDGKQARTPARAPLEVPTRALAEAIAAEWEAQEKHVDPRTMPCTRTANAAIDKVAAQRAEVADMLAGYGDSDLLCYRAESPVELVARQAGAWDPALDWAAEALGARLAAHAGVMHRAQDPVALDRLAGMVHAMSPFELAAFHDLVLLSGSLVLAFAVAAGWRDADSIWSLSRLEEDWQQEQWGEDAEAAEAAARRRADFLQAARFLDLARNAPLAG